mgnify:FL=1|jgi:hypothetical protein
MITDSDFGEAYYSTVNYVDFLKRGDRYKRLAADINDLLKKIGLNKGPVLDFGCAVGFVVEAMENEGYEDVSGVDISEWALNQCREKGLDVRNTVDWDKEYGLTFALDVLEHMNLDQVNDFLFGLKTETLVFRMPICAEAGEDYVLDCSRQDPTHQIRMTRDEWEDIFNRSGYYCVDLNLPTIYCSDGVYSGLAIRRD